MNIGINGFGRFGLHLLKYWLDRASDTSFNIKYINDDYLSIDEAYKIILQDSAVIFNKYKVRVLGDMLTFLEPNGSIYEIKYSNSLVENIPWIGKPKMVFECSGKNTLKDDCEFYIQGDTKRVLISATSWDADSTLVYGFNHQEYKSSHRVISYGSCTVNAFVPLADFINKKYGINDSDVSVIHNIQHFRLEENQTLIRKFCTLEKSGAILLDFINDNNFTVNYTVIPYSGVSIIDFRFQLENISE